MPQASRFIQHLLGEVAFPFQNHLSDALNAGIFVVCQICFCCSFHRLPPSSRTRSTQASSPGPVTARRLYLFDVATDSSSRLVISPPAQDLKSNRLKPLPPGIKGRIDDPNRSLISSACALPHPSCFGFGTKGAHRCPR